MALKRAGTLLFYTTIQPPRSVLPVAFSVIRVLGPFRGRQGRSGRRDRKKTGIVDVPVTRSSHPLWSPAARQSFRRRRWRNPSDSIGSASVEPRRQARCPPLAVLTLSEAAAYLRVAESHVQHLAETRSLPGREIGGEWRFLKAGLQDWLRAPTAGSGKEAFLALAGVMSREVWMQPP
jgi:excisionase family DNA binding protein